MLEVTGSDPLVPVNERRGRDLFFMACDRKSISRYQSTCQVHSGERGRRKPQAFTFIFAACFPFIFPRHFHHTGVCHLSPLADYILAFNNDDEIAWMPGLNSIIDMYF